MLFANFKIKMANFEMELRGGGTLNIFFFFKKWVLNPKPGFKQMSCLHFRWNFCVSKFHATPVHILSTKYDFPFCFLNLMQDIFL